MTKKEIQKKYNELFEKRSKLQQKILDIEIEMEPLILLFRKLDKKKGIYPGNACRKKTP